MKKINLVFCSSPDYSNNAKSLYDYIIENYKDFFHIQWVIQRKEVYYLLKDRLDCVLYGTKEFYIVMEKANVIFTTHAQLSHLKRKNQLYVELWHGVSPKKIGYLIQNITKSDINWTNTVSENIDYFIVPSDFWVPIFSSRFHVEPNRVLPLGFPVVRNIVNAKGGENLSKLLHKSLDSYNHIVYYMPTYRQNNDHEKETFINEKNIFNFSLYDEKILLDFLQNEKILLCVKRHPEEIAEYSIPSHPNIVNITSHELAKNGWCVDDILNAADLLITDYSSLGLEFLVLDKPVLYLNSDVQDYQTKRGILFSNFDFWTDGNTASNIDELIVKTNMLLKTKTTSNNKKNLLFEQALENGGCKNICDFLFDKNKINKNVKYYVSYQKTLKEQIENLNNQHQKDQSLLKLYKNDIFEKQAEIDKILNSKSWKIISVFRNMKNKILFWRK